MVQLEQVLDSRDLQVEGKAVRQYLQMERNNSSEIKLALQS